MKKLLCLVTALMLACCAASAFALEPLTLNTVDMDGNAVDNTLIRDAKLVLINFWEPWCGPCVNELPELEKLYETYADQGLLILGVYSTTSMKEDAQEIVTSDGITFPVLEWTSDMAEYETGYVPTTILTDAEGNVLIDEPYIGAKSYEGWEAVIKEYLQ